MMAKQIIFAIVGYVASIASSCFIIGLILVLHDAWLNSTWRSVGDLLDGGMWLMVVVGPILGLLLLLPAIAIIYFTEKKAIQSWPVYSVTAMLIALLMSGALVLGGSSSLYALGFIAACLLGGSGGGTVYWLIAGRSAGRWRAAPARGG